MVNELDDMKKDVATARDANRWLSSELTRGLRYLRVQRQEEVPYSMESQRLNLLNPRYLCQSRQGTI